MTSKQLQEQALDWKALRYSDRDRAVNAFFREQALDARSELTARRVIEDTWQFGSCSVFEGSYQVF